MTKNFFNKNKFTIHDLPKDERPRERLVKFGEQALSVQELLQLILGHGKSCVLKFMRY